MRILKLRRMTKDQEAVAGIVVAVMMVGLCLAVVSLVQVYYVPKWMKAREAEHLSDVEDQFARLKYTLDEQAAVGSMGMLGHSVPISTSITLGSENLGFLVSQRAFGHINLINQGSSCLLTMVSGASEQYDLSILKYQSENAYYLNQGFVLEAGSLILNQSGSTVFLIKPSLSMDFSNHVLMVNWTCINLEPVGNINSLSGYGTYPVQTKFLGNGSASFDNVATIAFSTYHPDIWRQLFVTLIESTPTNVAGYTFANNSDFDVQPFQEGENGMTVVSLDFITGSGHLIDKVIFNINSVHIAVQFAPGWIE
jgi:hypothetical protein